MVDSIVKIIMIKKKHLNDLIEIDRIMNVENYVKVNKKKENRNTTVVVVNLF